MNIKLLVIATVTLACMLIVLIQGKSLIQQPDVPHGIVSLELAFTVLKTKGIIAAWQQKGLLETAVKNVYIDFAFLITYSVFLYLCILTLVRNQSKKISGLGKWIARGALLAGVLDALENISMLQILKEDITPFAAALTGFFASVKFFLAALAIIFIITESVVKLLTKKGVI
ncbi:MAG TPA: hypothetical protein PLA68_04400 [Panacibacter sp.]|nr:hypothetical protein [Panacibacter sp.]